MKVQSKPGRMSEREHRMLRSMRSRAGLVCVPLMAIGLSVPACAHNGPPFPIFENRAFGPMTVSAWSNPDVGTGSFFVLIDPAKGAEVPSDLKVEIGVRPVSGRLPEAVYTAWRERLKGQVEYKAVVPFDAQEMWRVRVLLTSSKGGGEATTDVEVTPPGLGRWDLLLFLLPFLGVGLLWFKAVKTKRDQRRRRMGLKGQESGSRSDEKIVQS